MVEKANTGEFFYVELLKQYYSAASELIELHIIKEEKLTIGGKVLLKKL